MGYLIGVDQGGSKTAAVVANRDGRLLGAGFADGACHAGDGLERAMMMIDRAIASALAQAGLAKDRVGLLAAGLTGADWPEEYALLRMSLIETTGIDNVTVVNDCIAALRGGSDRPYGAVLCGGSGLNAAVRSPDGREFIFGYYIADEDQGATALGRRAIKAVVAGEAGLCRPMSLNDVILRQCGFATVEDLVRRMAKGPLPSAMLAGLAPLIGAAADAGEETAYRLLVEFGRDIARYVTAGLQRFAMLDMVIEVVLSGGIFRKSQPLLAETVAAAIRAAAPLAEVSIARYEPVVGAVLLALDEIRGGAVDLSVDELVQSSGAALGLLKS